ncbi:MAG: response regulator [bacterium]
MAKKKILIVDDEPNLLMILSTRLKYVGFEVETADNGEIAIEKAKKYIPHLILLDIMMPGMDGFSVLSRLKEEKKTRSVIIVMLTSKGDLPSIERALALGAVDYVVKPFSPVTIIEKIKKILRVK